MSNGVPEVNVDEAVERIAAGAVLLDVRTQDEFDEERIPGSQFITLSELQQRSAELPTDREIVGQCKSGGRSAQAAAWLNRNGFVAVNLAGGIDDWKLAGRPVEPGRED